MSAHQLDVKRKTMFCQRVKFAVAPMMDCTDRHCRAFHRVLSRKAFLYSEMLIADAVLHGNRNHLLAYDASEHPVGAQLGGSDPAALAAAAQIIADFGYDEVNLNCGCPSGRVQTGGFGACLMLDPDRVAAIVAAIKASVAIPVTIKCRIGVDDQDPEEALFTLVGRAAAAGVDGIIVHARKAWLHGLSPKENRDVPPLDYPVVYRLKASFPRLPIGINGGITTIAAARHHLKYVDGVMIGRAAYKTPALLIAVDSELFGQSPPVSDPFMAVEAILPYVAARLAEGIPLRMMIRPLLGLFAGRPGARAYRRHLVSYACAEDAGIGVLQHAVSRIRCLESAA
jgi:tRNA-dihydrouridine synthase A